MYELNLKSWVVLIVTALFFIVWWCRKLYVRRPQV